MATVFKTNYRNIRAVLKSGRHAAETISFEFFEKFFSHFDLGTPGDDPYSPDDNGTYGTMNEFKYKYNGWTYNQIMSNEKGFGDFGKGYKYAKGPFLRYVEDPIEKGKYIDMTHFLMIGKRGRIFGFVVESFQFFNYNSSSFKRQDLWSNQLGRDFWKEYRSSIEKNPRNIVNYIDKFLRSRKTYLEQPTWYPL